MRVTLDGDEEFLIMACDGLWDTLSPEGVIMFVHRSLVETGGDTKPIAKELVEEAKAHGSNDNITAIVVYLTPIIDLKKSELILEAAGVQPHANQDLFSKHFPIADESSHGMFVGEPIGANGSEEIFRSPSNQESPEGIPVMYSEAPTPPVDHMMTAPDLLSFSQSMESSKIQAETIKTEASIKDMGDIPEENIVGGAENVEESELETLIETTHESTANIAENEINITELSPSFQGNLLVQDAPDGGNIESITPILTETISSEIYEGHHLVQESATEEIAGAQSPDQDMNQSAVQVIDSEPNVDPSTEHEECAAILSEDKQSESDLLIESSENVATEQLADVEKTANQSAPANDEIPVDFIKLEEQQVVPAGQELLLDFNNESQPTESTPQPTMEENDTLNLDDTGPELMKQNQEQMSEPSPDIKDHSEGISPEIESAEIADVALSTTEISTTSLEEASEKIYEVSNEQVLNENTSNIELNSEKLQFDEVQTTVVTQVTTETLIKGQPPVSNDVDNASLQLSLSLTNESGNFSQQNGNLTPDQANAIASELVSEAVKSGLNTAVEIRTLPDLMVEQNTPASPDVIAEDPCTPSDIAADNDLSSIPDGLPEADGVLEDEDSEGDHDEEWSYIAGQDGKKEEAAVENKAQAAEPAPADEVPKAPVKAMAGSKTKSTGKTASTKTLPVSKSTVAKSDTTKKSTVKGPAKQPTAMIVNKTTTRNTITKKPADSITKSGAPKPVPKARAVLATATTSTITKREPILKKREVKPEAGPSAKSTTRPAPKPVKDPLAKPTTANATKSKDRPPLMAPGTTADKTKPLVKRPIAQSSAPRTTSTLKNVSKDKIDSKRASTSVTKSPTTSVASRPATARMTIPKSSSADAKISQTAAKPSAAYLKPKPTMSRVAPTPKPSTSMTKPSSKELKETVNKKISSTVLKTNPRTKANSTTVQKSSVKSTDRSTTTKPLAPKPKPTTKIDNSKAPSKSKLLLKTTSVDSKVQNIKKITKRHPKIGTKKETNKEEEKGAQEETVKETVNEKLESGVVDDDHIIDTQCNEKQTASEIKTLTNGDRDEGKLITEPTVLSLV